MHILVLILGTVLLPTACALKCYGCTTDSSGSCNQTIDCPASTQCGSFRIISYAGGSTPTDVKIKSCALAEQCVDASLNLGVARVVTTSKCCTSDLCNTQDAPDGSLSSPNGKKCFQCDRTNTTQCNTTLTCIGNEDYCISATVTVGGETTKLKGCASQLICSNAQSAQIPGIAGAKISCCQGNLCNSASSTTVGLLLFVTPLISLVLFS